MTPAFAGVTLHLLGAAAQTPVVSRNCGTKFKVFHLGEVDMQTPLASMVVSEDVSIDQFDPLIHNQGPLCVLSFSGCNAEILQMAGIVSGSTPILSLPEIWSKRNAFNPSHFENFDDFADQNSASPGEINQKFQEEYSEYCKKTDAAAVFIADCVVAFTKVMMQMSLEKRNLFSK